MAVEQAVPIDARGSTSTGSNSGLEILGGGTRGGAQGGGGGEGEGGGRLWEGLRVSSQAGTPVISLQPTVELTTGTS